LTTKANVGPRIGRDRKTALDAAKKIEARLTLGDMGITEKKERVPGFREYAELWLHTYVKPLRRETTFHRYGDVLRLYVYPIVCGGPGGSDHLKRHTGPSPEHPWSRLVTGNRLSGSGCAQRRLEPCH
jgi:hypothetical protein